MLELYLTIVHLYYMELKYFNRTIGSFWLNETVQRKAQSTYYMHTTSKDMQEHALGMCFKFKSNVAREIWKSFGKSLETDPVM